MKYGTFRSYPLKPVLKSLEDVVCLTMYDICRPILFRHMFRKLCFKTPGLYHSILLPQTSIAPQKCRGLKMIFLLGCFFSGSMIYVSLLKNLASCKKTCCHGGRWDMLPCSSTAAHKAWSDNDIVCFMTSWKQVLANGTDWKPQ